jgi:hypothetical protein
MMQTLRNIMIRQRNAFCVFLFFTSFLYFTIFYQFISSGATMMPAVALTRGVPRDELGERTTLVSDIVGLLFVKGLLPPNLLLNILLTEFDYFVVARSMRSKEVRLLD